MSICMSARIVRDPQRMDHVGLAGIASLSLVCLWRQAECFFEPAQVFVWTQCMDLLGQFRVELLNLAGCGGHFGRRHCTS